MISGIHVEVVLAAGYATFLVAVAFALELLARHSHQRSERYRNSGFVYLRKMDSWQCPAGQQLTRAEVDYNRRTVYYRGPADACNSCPLKHNCTDSDEGRLLESRMDSWLESELRRFHRGISLALLLLATILLVVEAAHYTATRELAIAGSLLLAIGVIETRLFISFLTRQQ